MEIALTINGFSVDARFDDFSVRTLLLPLLETLTRRQQSLGRRMTVLLAAPPGAGKSTLAAFLEKLSLQEPGLAPVQARGMDGVHFHQDYILYHTAVRDGREIPMRLVKGAPDTFDVCRLRHALAYGCSRWPVYDRNLHDVVENAAAVTAPILLVEGNWLLLNRPEWTLPCDASIYIDADEALLRTRLIDRKMRGGSTREEAEAHYLRTDGPNIRLCRECRRPADFTFVMTGDGTYVKG